MGTFHFLNLGAFSTAAGRRGASSPGEHCVKWLDLVRANGLVFVTLKTFRQKNQSSWDDRTCCIVEDVSTLIGFGQQPEQLPSLNPPT